MMYNAANAASINAREGVDDNGNRFENMEIGYQPVSRRKCKFRIL